MSEKRKKNYTIRKPIGVWYAVGIFAATCLPVLWGSLNSWPLAEYFLRGCDGIRSGDCWGPNHFVRNKQLMIPMYLTFVFGTLFAALIGTLKVRANIKNISKSFDFAIIGLKSASWAHFIAAIIHIIYLLVKYAPEVTSSTRNKPQSSDDSLIILFAAIPFHLFLWIFITVPLALICGLIFKSVAVVEIK